MQRVFLRRLLQLCPVAFRVRAPPPSAPTSSLRMRGTKTSCRTRSPWTQRRRTRTAKTSKLLIGQDLGNPASQTLTLIKPLGWAQRSSTLRGLPCPSVTDEPRTSTIRTSDTITDCLPATKQDFPASVALKHNMQAVMLCVHVQLR